LRAKTIEQQNLMQIRERNEQKNKRLQDAEDRIRHERML
jgi:hypothetical protein